MTVLKINGQTFRQPATMKVDIQDIDSSESGRNQQGDMMRDRVVGGANAKRKISCTWKGLYQNEISALLKAMDDVSFQITYPDPYVGDMRTATVYVGDRSAPIWRNGCKDNSQIIWESLTANFVEL
ncbi:MAG: DUF6711 family protein [Eubacterium sp.]